MVAEGGRKLTREQELDIIEEEIEKDYDPGQLFDNKLSYYFMIGC